MLTTFEKPARSKTTSLDEPLQQLSHAEKNFYRLLRRKKWFKELPLEEKLKLVNLAGKLCQTLVSAFGYPDSENGLLQAFADVTRAFGLDGHKDSTEYLRIFSRLSKLGPNFPKIIRLALLRSSVYDREPVSEITNIQDLVVSEVYPMIRRELCELCPNNLAIVYAAHERINKIVRKYSFSNVRLNTYLVDTPFLFAWIYYAWIRAGRPPSVTYVAWWITQCDKEWLINAAKRVNALKYRLMWQRLQTEPGLTDDHVD